MAGLLGKSLPAELPGATREAYLLDLLSQAASACREAGGRLVPVDGLDEERGVMTGTITEPDERAQAPMHVVKAAAGVGNLRRAEPWLPTLRPRPTRTRTSSGEC